MTRNFLKVNRPLKFISQLKASKYEAQDHEKYNQMRQLTLSHSWEDLIQSQQCLMKSGQLGDHSASSIINPGVLYQKNQFLMLCRGEQNSTVWSGNFLANQAAPLWCTLDNKFNLKSNFRLTYSEVPPQSRPEDWRLFKYQDKIYTNHTIYTLLDQEQWIIRSRPGIAEVNIQNKTIKLCWMLEPPFEPLPEEKNWSFFNKDRLHELFEQYPVYNRKNSSLGISKGIDPRKGIIISFPRNGLNWVRYCIEHLTGLRTAGKVKLVENGELAVYRTHNVQQSDLAESCYCTFYDKEGKPLHRKVVLIIRDYRESFLRIAKSQQDFIPTSQEIRDGKVFHFRDYFENLKAYDEFQGEKLLVYYHNLISDFTEVIKILDFFEFTYDLTNFDLEYHYQQSLELYNRQHKSYTKNNPYHFTFHQSQVDDGIIEAIDDFVDQNYQYLAKIYLKQ